MPIVAFGRFPPFRPPGDPHPIRCSPLTQRTVPDEARITTLSVVRIPPRRCLTPRSSDPSVTPVAAKMTSPFARRSEEHTSELQSLMRISYAVFCLKKKKHTITHNTTIQQQ